MKISIAIVCCFFLFSNLASQTSENFEVSLLTCSEGKQVYSVFGHSALRIQNNYSGEDLVYDYGIFDFDTPMFFFKFLKGNLEYKVDKRNYELFLKEYQLAGRSVVEQKLNLTDLQARQILADVKVNLKPENRYYIYKSLHDNCSTRLKDLIFTPAIPSFHSGKKLHLSYRDFLAESLEKHPWIKFGTDLLLGTEADKVLSFEEQMFLPKTLYKNISAFRNTKLDTSNLILNENQIFTSDYEKNKPILTPLRISILAAILLILLISFVPKFLTAFYPIMNSLLFIASAFLMFMWFGTEHLITKDNWNIIWANPAYIFLITLKKRQLKYALAGGLMLLNFSLLLLWIIIPQDLNEALIPMVMTIVFVHFSVIIKHVCASKSR